MDLNRKIEECSKGLMHRLEAISDQKFQYLKDLSFIQNKNLFSTSNTTILSVIKVNRSSYITSIKDERCVIVAYH